MYYVVYNDQNGRIYALLRNEYRISASSPANAAVIQMTDEQVGSATLVSHKVSGGVLVALSNAEKDALYAVLENNIKQHILNDIESNADTSIGSEATDGINITNRMRLEIGELVDQHLIKQFNPAYTLATAAELPRRVDKGNGTFLEITTLAQLYDLHRRMVDRTHGVRKVSTDDRNSVVSAADRTALRAVLPTLVTNGSLTQDQSDTYEKRIP